MAIPLLLFGLGILAVLGYFTRERVTWTNASPKGGLGMAIIIFIIFAVIGYLIDSYMGISLIFQYMFAAGGALQAIAGVFWIVFILLMLSMIWSAKKTGMMVS